MKFDEIPRDFLFDGIRNVIRVNNELGLDETEILPSFTETPDEN